MVEQEEEQVQEWLELSVETANCEIMHLKRSFYAPVSVANLNDWEPKVHRVMLIRFRFSGICIEHTHACRVFELWLSLHVRSPEMRAAPVNLALKPHGSLR